MAASDLYEGNRQVWPTINRFTITALEDLTAPLQPWDVTRTFDPLFIPGLAREVVYQPFLDCLTSLGYREYQLRDQWGIGHPERLTYAGFDTNQASAGPSLFLFPYDWRHSNQRTAADLKDYLDGIYRLHPNAEIALVAHSMGGLVVRRYLLMFPGAHRVTRVMTIGSPFLGTPVAVYRMFRGDFYGFGVVDALQNEEIKRLLAGFPGFFELLPARSYFATAPGEIPVLRECSEDLNGVGGPNQVYTYEMLREFLDSARANHPGGFNEAFHMTSQDDWHLDAPGIRYVHVVGLQHQANTVVGLRVTRNRFLNSREFEPLLGCGDETVAFWSAYRHPGLRAPNTETVVLRGWGRSALAGYGDDEVEHTGLMGNPRTHEILRKFLNGEPVALDGDDPVGALDSCTFVNTECAHPSLGNLRLQPGTVSFQTAGHTGQVYRIESSGNLITWSLLGRVTNSAALSTFTAQQPTTDTRRFFRAIPE